MALLRPSSSTGNEHDTSSLPTLISSGDFEPFATLAIRQYALSQAFQVCTAFVMERAFSRISNYTGYLHPPDNHLAAYERRRRIALGRCQNEMSARRVVCRFCDIATQGAGDAAQSESRAAMLDAIARSERGGSAELLEAQTESEVGFKAAITALQDEVGVMLGARDRWHVDFSPLSGDDFPSAILRRCLETA